MKGFTALLLGAVWALAQTPGDPYREAYRAWRDSDPTLERDAAGGGAQLSDRANRAAAAAANYGSTRSAYLQSLAAQTRQPVQWLGSIPTASEPDVAPVQQLQAVVNEATATVGRTLANYGGEKDRAIQQVRQALDRERAALSALNRAIEERRKLAAKNAEVFAALEMVRVSALEQYQSLAAGFGTAASQEEQETAAWAAYYRSMAETSEPPPPPVSSPSPEPVPVTIGGVRIMNPATARAANPASVTAPPAESARAAKPGPREEPAATSQPGSVARLLGEWVYPPAGGLYYRMEPEAANLVVSQEGGRLNGALSVRFKLPPGSVDDPQIRFSFAGEIRPAGIQVLPLETTDGAKGSMELIPGSAFNLVEVNFRTQAKPGKISLGNFVLIKK
jgi:hypothetical protein